MDAVSTPSAALEAANKRLLALRAQARQTRQAAGLPVDVAATLPPADEQPLASAGASIALHNGQKLLDRYRRRDDVQEQTGSRKTDPSPLPEAGKGMRQAEPIPQLPPNLGGEVQSWAKQGPDVAEYGVDDGLPPPPRQQVLNLHGATVRHYPGIGVAALEKGQAAAYRVWLACRSLDRLGQGWLPQDVVRHHLTGDDSPLRLFGWRRLRQVLRAGNGRFWTWDRHGRLWLHGAARVAAALGVQRLHGRPVAFPLAAIVAGIGDFKAHLYAAWHSGRRAPNPVTRRVQEQLTGVPARTQRRYCRVAGVTRTANYAVGPRYSDAAMQERAWRQGRGVFEFVDVQGQQGEQNGRYVAWQLPSSHDAIHHACARGRQRKVNRKLTDLVTNGGQGNGQGTIYRVFHADGAAARRTYNREPEQDAYWPGNKTRQRHTMWHCLEGNS